MQKVVMGIVDTPTQAELTVERLHSLGVAPGDISVLYPDRRGAYDFGFERRSKAPEGALVGVVLAAIVGFALGGAAGLGLVPTAMVGVLVSAGPVLAALSAAAVAGVMGGLIGGLIGRSFPEIEARHYAGKVTRGSILVAVHAERRRDVARAREVFSSVAASDVTAASEADVDVGAHAPT
jgi:hypothetical protein